MAPSLKKPIISVIVTCYNLGQFIDEAIDSVLGQTFRDFEIIVVDDGSTAADTIAILDKLNNKDPRITVYHTANRGLSAARNYGIMHSNGKYILPLDADDRIDGSYLEKASNILNNNLDIAIVNPWIKTFGREETEVRHDAPDVAMLLTKNTISVASVFRREVWTKVGGYDENLNSFEDWDFWISAAEKGFSWQVLREFMFFYRIRGNSMLTTQLKSVSKTLSLHEQIYNKHSQFYQKYFLRVLINKDKEFRWTWKELLKHQKIKSENEDRIRYLEKNIHENIDLKGEFQEMMVTFSELTKRNNMILERLNRLLDILKNSLGTLGFPRATVNLLKRFKSAIRERRLSVNRFARIAPQKKLPEDSVVVSIVIPCYNYGKYLDEAIKSVLSQSWKRLEIIVVDDGSNDPSTIDVLNSLEHESDTYPVPIRLIRKRNGGIVSARNMGIKAASGRYIVCLDADDMLEKSYLEKCVWVLESNAQIGVVYSYLRKFGNATDTYEFGEFNLNALKSWNQVCTAAMFRKRCWEEVGGYKEVMKYGHEDWEFWLSIAEKGWEGKRIKEELFLYRVHAKDSLSNEAMKINRNLVTRIKDLHPELYADKDFEVHLRRPYKKPAFQDSLLNADSNSNQKVILFLAPWVIGGGAERLWTNYAVEMAKVGYRFLMITFEDDDHTVYEELKESVLGIFNLPKFLSRDLWLTFIKEQFSKYNIEYVLISNARFAYESLKTIREFGNATVMDIIYNDSEFGFISESSQQDSLIDMHLVNNPAIIDTYKSKYGISEGKVCYLPSPINLNFFKNTFDPKVTKAELDIPVDNKVISYIGRLSEEKNLDTLILAVADLCIEEATMRDKLTLLIVGNGGYKYELEKLVRELNIQKNVVFLPFVDDPRKIYAASDIFALISSIDGFPLSILEALAMGIPVLATDVGAKKEVLKQGINSFLLPSPDRFSVVKALKDMLTGNYFKDRSKFRETVEPYDRAELAMRFMEEIGIQQSKPAAK